MFTDTTCTSNSVKHMYIFRGILQELYRNNMSNNGDLTGSVFDLINEDDDIESIEGSAEDLNFVIKMKSSEKINQMVSKLRDIISKYVCDNSGNFTISTDLKDEFDDWIILSPTIFDCTIMGNIIQIML